MLVTRTTDIDRKGPVCRLKQLVKKWLPASIAYYRLPHHLSGKVLLTFDDGPHPDFTLPILDLLDTYHAKAVFFVVGKYVKQHGPLLQEIWERGHLVGNHTFEHPNDRPPRFRQYLQDVVRCQDSIADIIGQRPTLFRPPLGRLTPASIRTGWRLHYTTLLWSNEGGVWGNNKDLPASDIAGRMCASINDRDIVLFHDNNGKMPQILSRFLPVLQQRGFDLHTAVNAFVPHNPGTTLAREFGDI